MNRHLGLGSVLLALLLLTGCGKKSGSPGKATGTITYQGKTLDAKACKVAKKGEKHIVADVSTTGSISLQATSLDGDWSFRIIDGGEEIDLSCSSTSTATTWSRVGDSVELSGAIELDQCTDETVIDVVLDC